jgi:hypothetical protein
LYKTYLGFTFYLSVDVLVVVMIVLSVRSRLVIFIPTLVLVPFIASINLVVMCAGIEKNPVV